MTTDTDISNRDAAAAATKPMRLSGLEPVTIDSDSPFVNAGRPCAGPPRGARAPPE